MKKVFLMILIAAAFMACKKVETDYVGKTAVKPVFEQVQRCGTAICTTKVKLQKNPGVTDSARNNISGEQMIAGYQIINTIGSVLYLDSMPTNLNTTLLTDSISNLVIKNGSGSNISVVIPKPKNLGNKIIFNPGTTVANNATVNLNVWLKLYYKSSGTTKTSTLIYAHTASGKRYVANCSAVDGQLMTNGWSEDLSQPAGGHTQLAFLEKSQKRGKTQLVFLEKNQKRRKHLFLTQS